MPRADRRADRLGAGSRPQWPPPNERGRSTPVGHPAPQARPVVLFRAQADIVHEEKGILVLEVKSGSPTRDSAGRWWIGGHTTPNTSRMIGR